MRSATSRTPFAGSVAAILMYLHRLAYLSAPYVSIPRSSTACSSLDHCASYRFVPVVPACEPDLTASAAAASSILVPTRLFPSFASTLTLPLMTSDASAFMCAGGGMDADAGGGIICGIIPPPLMFMSMFEWCGLMSGLTSGTANASSLSKSGKWSSTSSRPLRCPRSNLSMETWCASWRSSPCVADGSSGSVIVRACSAFRRLLHPRDTRRAPWRTGYVRVSRARPLAACEGGRRPRGLARACHRSKHSETNG
mmetsp:Transcript_13984/g.38253  ORF Transcript_13984/g.38253 Transcript_13984/m.38253 type:complete len:254 (-) Transcript_13984:161-922(-)